MKYTVEEEENEVTISVEKKKWSLEVVRMAAHVVGDRAYAQVSDEDGELSVTLHSKLKADKSALEGLAALFDREVQNQDLRLKLVVSNRATMEYIVSRGLIPATKASGPEGAEPEAELTEEQKSDIDRLIAEAEIEIKDLKNDKSGADPLGITKTWEEQNQ